MTKAEETDFPFGKSEERLGNETRISKDDEALIDRKPEHVEEEATTKGVRNWRGTLIVIGLAYANFWTAACMSLQAPFFPKEAELKGATPTQYGFVFGIFELVVVVMSPVYGKLIPRVTPKFLVTCGVLLEGIACALFGVLDVIPAGKTYIAMAFVVRIVEGFGAAALMTSSFTIVASEFPKSVATTFSMMETAFGFGLIVGPTIGGALYQAGGFLLPFVVCGAFLGIGSLLLCFLLPPVEKIEPLPPRDLKAFLMDGGIMINTLAILTSILFVGFNAATLEPHLRKFNLSPVILGTIFIITGGIYAFTTPIWGRICDKGTDPFLITLVGYILTCIGLPFLGPLPFMPFKATLWLVIVSLVIIGLGLAAKLVASFVGALHQTLERGFPDNLATYGMVSALFSSACSTGAFIGPSIGGFLLDTTGYELGTAVIFAEELFFLVVIVIYVSVRYYKKRAKNPERSPLLRSGSETDTKPISSV